MLRMRSRGQCDIAGDANAQARQHHVAIAQRFASFIEEPVRSCGGWRGFATIEGCHRAIGQAAHHEAATTDAGALRFHHRQRQHDCDSSVGSATAPA